MADDSDSDGSVLASSVASQESGGSDIFKGVEAADDVAANAKSDKVADASLMPPPPSSPIARAPRSAGGGPSQHSLFRVDCLGLSVSWDRLSARCDHMLRLQRSFILPGPRSPNLAEVRQRRIQAGIRVGAARMRAKKNCKLCKRSNNGPDPVLKSKRIRWGYEGRETTCPDTGMEVVEGKIDFYCRQAL